ncbi:hypothetical protein AVEN_228340-1 [Araneus ventricosus]|uniref:Reverse transcriptase domain-containing protein n=1 Tax=Araneus ventricosus TaxID=182803 RepID=A0A4Y2K6M8_ARAVE|nr:hypothetical protein AVEN_228340-1 [Araneus ventricosus]
MSMRNTQDTEVEKLNKQQNDCVSKMSLMMEQMAILPYHISKLQNKSTDTNSRPYVNPPLRRQVTCYYCNIRGHLEPECRKKYYSALKEPILCTYSPRKKADNSYRLVADLRELNSKTVPDNFPLPNLTEMINNLSGTKYFSTLDHTSGFHQMVMHSDHTKYSAIATEFGLYEYKRLLLV